MSDVSIPASADLTCLWSDRSLLHDITGVSILRDLLLIQQNSSIGILRILTKFHSSQEDDGNISFIHDRRGKIHVIYEKYDANWLDSRSVGHLSSCDLEDAISANDSDFSCAIISGNHMTPPHVTLFTVDLHSREHVWCSSAWHDRPRGHESDERCGLTIDDGPWLYDAVAR